MSIRDNTTSLEEILATVNALPSAGSGGGGEIAVEEFNYTKNTATATFAVGTWTVNNVRTDGLVAIFVYYASSPMEDASTVTRPAFFYLVEQKKLYHVFTGLHPIGGYGAHCSYFSNVESTANGTTLTLTNASLPSYTPQYPGYFNAVGIYQG